MKKNISLILALTLGASMAAGCATSKNGDDDGNGGGSGSDDAPKSMDATGKYQVSSTFDIQANMPGTVGDVTRQFVAATDDPTDPAKWMLDQIIAKMGSGSLKSTLTAIEPFVAGYLNDRLLQIAPDFVTTMLQVGNDFGQMAKGFGLNETLEVAGSAQAYNGTVTATGVHFKVDNVETDIGFAEHMLMPVAAANVKIGLDATGKLDIGEHKLPLSYGKILRIGLDEMIIPMIDPTAGDLATLFQHKIDCVAVGQAINDAITSQFGFGGGAGTWQAACVVGLQYAAATIYTKIAAIDASALEFDLTGVAKGLDTNKDGKMDKIQTGAWSGTLGYNGTPAPLAAATFIGARM